MAAVNADPQSEHGHPWPNGGTYYGHFSKHCPIDEQIDRMVEVAPLPQYDPDLWMRLSVQWLRDHAAHFFDYDFDHAPM
jgi:hypothetical protein